MEKVNFSEASLLYLDQLYLMVRKENKKIYYCDYYTLGQIVSAANPPQDVSSYTLNKGEVKTTQSKYNSKTGEFLGLYETVEYLLVRGSPEEVLFNCSHEKEKSKILYSHYRRTILNAFCITIFSNTGLRSKVGRLRVNFLVSVYSFLRLLIRAKR